VSCRLESKSFMRYIPLPVGELLRSDDRAVSLAGARDDGEVALHDRPDSRLGEDLNPPIDRVARLEWVQRGNTGVEEPMAAYVTLKALADELRMEPSHLQRWLRQREIPMVWVRSRTSRRPLTMALSGTDAARVRELRKEEGFGDTFGEPAGKLRQIGLRGRL
jgi:hypothetical protein